MTIRDPACPLLLAECTYVVIDLETTGTSPDRDVITEVGGVKLRGGEVLGTFGTIVNPGRSIPPTITTITGITEAMTTKAPRIEPVLASLQEFVGDPADPTTVLVGHNVGFDASFLAAAMIRDGRAPFGFTSIDTVMLSRRLLRNETPDHRLGTIAEVLDLANRPTHRALDDALATADLLHVLLERAAGLGAESLDDLIELPRLARHPHAPKLRLTNGLPRSAGIHLFRDRRGTVLDIGASTDIRAAARDRFEWDGRRSIEPLLARTSRIDHKRCSSLIEARVLRHRLAAHLGPGAAEKARWLRLPPGLDPRHVTLARRPSGKGLFVGPIMAMPTALASRDAVRHALTVDGSGGDAAAERLDGGWRGVLAELAARLRRSSATLRATGPTAEADEVDVWLDAITSVVSRCSDREAILRCDRLVVRNCEGQRFHLRHGQLSSVLDPTGAGSPGGHSRPRDIEMTPRQLVQDPAQLDGALAGELDIVLDWITGDDPGDPLEIVEGTIACELPVPDGTTGLPFTGCLLRGPG